MIPSLILSRRPFHSIERIVDHLNIAPVQEKEPQRDNAPEEIFELHNVISQKPGLVVTEPLENIELVKTIVETVKSRVENIDPKKPVLRKRKKIVVKKAEEMVSTDNKLLSREAVMDIIHSMRAKGDTFDMVASRLVELGQPTFSGRGEWHAQTIHRLCNKK